jgi:hypothetical protein
LEGPEKLPVHEEFRRWRCNLGPNVHRAEKYFFASSTDQQPAPKTTRVRAQIAQSIAHQLLFVLWRRSATKPRPTVRALQHRD